jgi:amino acid permease
MIIDNTGACAAYFRIFGETVNAIVQYFANESVYNESIFLNSWNNWFYVVIAFILMAFFIFHERIDTLSHISFLGVTAIFVFFISIIIMFFYKLHLGLIPEIDSRILFPSNSAVEILSGLCTVFLAYTWQFNVFPIYFSLKERNNKNMLISTAYGTSFCFIIYLSSAILGFLMYRDILTDTILNAMANDLIIFRGKDSFIIFLLVLINISFIISATMSIPLMFFSLKANFLGAFIFIKNRSTKNERLNKKELEEGLLQTSYKLHKTSERILIVLLYIIVVVIAITVPQLKSVSVKLILNILDFQPCWIHCSKLYKFNSSKFIFCSHISLNWK